MKPLCRQGKVLQQSIGLLFLLSLLTCALGCGESGDLPNSRSPRQTGWIRVANFSNRSIPVIIEGQSLGNGLSPGIAGPFYKKRAGAVDVKVDGQASEATVDADDASTIYLIEKDDKVQSISVGSEPRKGKVASASVRVVNLLLDKEIRCNLKSAQFGKEFVAAPKSGSETFAVDSGHYEIDFWIAGEAPSRLSTELEKGRGYSIVIVRTKAGLTAKVLDNNPKSDMAMGQESGT